MKPCCEDQANRSEPETPNLEKPELTMTTCRVCGGKHYELDADQIHLLTEAPGL